MKRFIGGAGAFLLDAGEILWAGVCMFVGLFFWVGAILALAGLVYLLSRLF
jgi:hypothetical protein